MSSSLAATPSAPIRLITANAAALRIVAERERQAGQDLARRDSIRRPLNEQDADADGDAETADENHDQHFQLAIPALPQQARWRRPRSMIAQMRIETVSEVRQRPDAVHQAAQRADDADDRHHGEEVADHVEQDDPGRAAELGPGDSVERLERRAICGPGNGGQSRPAGST